MTDGKIEELEKIVSELEREGTTLERGMELFEKGIALTRECLDELGRSKGRITELKKQMDGMLETAYGEENE